MKIRQKRYQYWGTLDRNPTILWTRWFDFNGIEHPIQLKGHKSKDLLNEYRTIERS